MALQDQTDPSPDLERVRATCCCNAACQCCANMSCTRESYGPQRTFKRIVCIDVDDHAVLFMLEAHPLNVRAIVIELHRDLHANTPSQGCLDCGCLSRSTSFCEPSVQSNQIFAFTNSHLIVICAD